MKKCKMCKVCKVCKVSFIAISSLDKECSQECKNTALNDKKVQDEAKVSLKLAKSLLRPLKDVIEDSQKVFNTYIRLRDKESGCISCSKDKNYDGVWHAGHYLSSGHHQALRFHEDNVHKQCSQCNIFLHGNLIRYRQGLAKKIGCDRIEHLENSESKHKYTREELESIKEQYKEKIKFLKS